MSECEFCGGTAFYRYVPNGDVIYGPRSIAFCRACLTLYYLALEMVPRAERG